MEDKRARRGLLLVLAASVCFSIGGLGVKMIPWQALSINAFRSIISVIMLLIFAAVTRQKFRLTRGVLIGAGAVCMNTICFTIATKLTTAANAILLEFTSPAFVILFMLLIFKQKPKRRDIVACLIVFAGIACFFLDGLSSGNIAGNIFALIAGMGYAWIFMLNKLPGANPLLSTIIGQAAAVLLGLPSLLRETDFSAPTMKWALIMGILQLGLAYVFLTAGIKYAPPIPASLMAGIEPVLNPIIVAVTIGETLSGLSIVGGVVVFVTVMIYNIVSVRAESAQPKSQ